MPRSQPPIIALLTDFGTADWYVACLKGVLLSRCPQARLVDITHDVPPQDVVAGAVILASAMSWFPPRTVFLCVVDPGVGTARPLLAAQAGGYRFVGPDNGVLALALDRVSTRRVVRLTNRRIWLPALSHTFHGRDIMAPVAAHLAAGRPLVRLGPPVSRYQPLAIAPVRARPSGRLAGRVIYIDRFGNLITNVPAQTLAGPGRRVRYQRRDVRVVQTYADGRPGELIALAGSSGWVELAVRNGSAAARCRARRGEQVEMRSAPSTGTAR
ncbi:MAG: SAM-dependent chlorinase/fluorinase [Candidatus Omnitrophica bacterium]|nr:SAM-dependent chlorinase/fluorinase [Candidatus Omnitrophota bacterium]